MGRKTDFSTQSVPAVTELGGKSAQSRGSAPTLCSDSLAAAGARAGVAASISAPPVGAVGLGRFGSHAPSPLRPIKYGPCRAAHCGSDAKSVGRARFVGPPPPVA